METIQLILEIFLGLCNCCIMLAIFWGFIRRPHNNLEDRVKTVEVQVEEMKNSLYQGNDRFREQKDMNEVFINCMLSFIDFEIAFCMNSGYEHSTDLMKAKEVLQHYLARK